MGDTTYNAAENLEFLVVGKNIEPHIPIWDKAKRKDNMFSSDKFSWRTVDDEYRCPQGKPLRRSNRKFKVPRSGVTKANTIIYRFSAKDCKTCPLKQLCCPKSQRRKVVRSIHEAARDVARSINQTDE